MAAVTVLVTYRPKKGKERVFLGILKRHWPALSRARLVTSERAHVWRATDKRTRRTYYRDAAVWAATLSSFLARSKTPAAE